MKTNSRANSTSKVILPSHSEPNTVLDQSFLTLSFSGECIELSEEPQAPSLPDCPTPNTDIGSTAGIVLPFELLKTVKTKLAQASQSSSGLQLPADAEPKREDRAKSSLPTLAEIAKTYRTLDYFWYPWIPYAEVTIINGDGGVGKSYLNCAIVAHRAMGLARLALPGDDQVFPPMRSLIINNEDHNDRILPSSSLTWRMIQVRPAPQSISTMPKFFCVKSCPSR